MVESLDAIKTRFDTVEQRIRGIKDYRVQRDLLKMSRSYDGLFKAISIEEIECRRHKQLTSKYNSLVAQLAQSIETLEEYTTFALLLNP